MAKFDRITVNPEQMNGQPCIRGMRIPVRRLLLALATYEDRDELFADYPGIEEDDIRPALEFAAASLDGEILDLVASP